MPWQKVSYGGPFRGYVSSVDKTDVSPNSLSGDSREYRVDAIAGKMVGRGGSAVLGDTFGALVGLLEVKFGAKARCFIEFSSPSLTDGLSTYGLVYTDETDKEGCFYFRSSNSGGINQVLGQRYSTTHYPLTSNDLSTFEHKWTVLWAENATTPAQRGTSTTQRKLTCAGTRRAISSGRSILFPDLQATPLEWYDRRFNDATGSGIEPERVRPWGHYPPLWPPRFISASQPSPGTDPRAWAAGDQFFVDVIFGFEDGSTSMPWRPFTKANLFGSSNLTGEFINQYGVVSLAGTIGQYYEYVRMEKIPLGPAGTVRRYIRRSTKVNSASGEIPRLDDMRLWEVIEDNTTETFDSYRGDDLSLLDPLDTPFLHNRHVWPKRGRYSWSFDGRVAVGYLKDNPSAIVICPTSNVTALSELRATNGTDNKTFTDYWWVRVYDNAGTKTLQLRLLVAASVPGAPASQSIAIGPAGTLTLTGLCDTINATTIGSTAGAWVAQVAPGADPLADAFNLAFTTGQDYGDDSGSIITDGTTGNMRCWNNAWPGILYFTQSYLATPANKSASFMHTEAGPDLKILGSYGSAFTFANGPAYDIKPPEDAGVLMGGWPLLDGCVVFYSKAIYRYQNKKGGTTGADEDYRLYRIADKGCIAWDSIAGGNNWCGCLTADGYLVTGGNESDFMILTYDVLNAAIGTGDLVYEVGQCINAASGDSDGAWCSAKVIGDALYLSFRSSGSATYPDRVFEYSFAASAAASGLAQVLDGQGQPFGWSTPWKIGYGTLGSARKSQTVVKLGAKEESTSAYTTADGRIDQFDTGLTDPGPTAMSPIWYARMDSPGGIKDRVRCRRVTIKHKSSTGGILTLKFSRDAARASISAYTMASTSATSFAMESKRIHLNGQTPARVIEFSGLHNGASDSVPELWGIEAEIKVLDSRPLNS